MGQGWVEWGKRVKWEISVILKTMFKKGSAERICDWILKYLARYEGRGTSLQFPLI